MTRQRTYDPNELVRAARRPPHPALTTASVSSPTAEIDSARHPTCTAGCQRAPKRGVLAEAGRQQHNVALSATRHRRNSRVLAPIRASSSCRRMRQGYQLRIEVPGVFGRRHHNPCGRVRRRRAAVARIAMLRAIPTLSSCRTDHASDCMRSGCVCETPAPSLIALPAVPRYTWLRRPFRTSS